MTALTWKYKQFSSIKFGVLEELTKIEAEYGIQERIAFSLEQISELENTNELGQLKRSVNNEAIPLLSRMTKLESIIEIIRQLRNIDKEMLLWLSLARWLLRSVTTYYRFCSP